MEYEAVKGGEILDWNPECQAAFIQLRAALMSTPAQGLPSLEKPFDFMCMKGAALLWGH